MYDPIKRTEEVRRYVVKVEDHHELRKYYRFRGGRWYGGIATADAVGCNLSCKFCWGWRTNSQPQSVGTFYRPEEVAEKLLSIARQRGYKYVRISGGEPTISVNHLLQLLEEIERASYVETFILETNGILIGFDESIARKLAQYRKIHVRVSLKGCTREEFALLTDAYPDAFELQLRALKHLLKHGVECHPAVMLSFSTRESFRKLLEALQDIDSRLPYMVEEEYVILYPHVVERLNRYGLKPRIALTPRGEVVDYGF